MSEGLQEVAWQLIELQVRPRSDDTKACGFDSIVRYSWSLDEGRGSKCRSTASRRQRESEGYTGVGRSIARKEAVEPPRASSGSAGGHGTAGYTQRAGEFLRRVVENQRRRGDATAAADEDGAIPPTS